MSAETPYQVALAEAIKVAVEAPVFARDALLLCVRLLIDERKVPFFRAALRQVREDLGYTAGYHDFEVRRAVERAYRAIHPYFGSVANGKPTAEQAFKLGQSVGEMAKQGRIEVLFVQSDDDAEELEKDLRPFEERLRAKMKERYGD